MLIIVSMKESREDITKSMNLMCLASDRNRVRLQDRFNGAKQDNLVLQFHLT